jgi:hypothetical protein
MLEEDKMKMIKDIISKSVWYDWAILAAIIVITVAAIWSMLFS